MKKVTIEIPESEEELKKLMDNIREYDKGCKKEMEVRWRSWINRATFLGWKKIDGHHRMQRLYPLFNCENCKYVGTEFWHCHNPKSHKCHINVDPHHICKEFEPNIGLILLLWYKVWNKESEERRKEDIKFLNELKKKK